MRERPLSLPININVGLLGFDGEDGGVGLDVQMLESAIQSGGRASRPADCTCARARVPARAGHRGRQLAGSPH